MTGEASSPAGKEDKMGPEGGYEETQGARTCPYCLNGVGGREQGSQEDSVSQERAKSGGDRS